MRQSLLIPLACLCATVSSPIHAATLQLNVQVTQTSGSSLTLYSLQSEDPATQADLLTYNDSASAVFQGQLLGTASYSHSAMGRAAFGNLGAGVSMSIGGDFAGNPVANGFSEVSYTDLVTFSDVQGTPAYLRVSWHVEGGGIATANLSSWTVASVVYLGNARILVDGACGDITIVCWGRAGLYPANSANPAFKSVYPSLSQDWFVPLSMIELSGNAFPIYSRLTTTAVLYQNGLLGPEASVEVNYDNSSRLGGFQFFDENFNPISANFSSESGFDYTQPLGEVPEPATITLLGFGFLAILLRKRP